MAATLARGMPEPNPKDAANFGWLTPWFARGAEPNPTGYRWLKETGFTTIVNLRAEDNTEALLCDALGLGHVQVPVVDNLAPSDQQALSFLAMCADGAHRPLFVHCESGHGRTSTFCILLRLAQGWRLDDAIEEQRKNFGFLPDHDRAQVAFLQTIKIRLKAGELKLPAIA